MRFTSGPLRVLNSISTTLILQLGDVSYLKARIVADLLVGTRSDSQLLSKVLLVSCIVFWSHTKCA